MKIPSRNVVGWAHEVVSQCLVSRDARIQRGAMYRNVYLTGSDKGDPQTYPRTYSFIDNLSSYLYSPVELRFLIESYGSSSRADRAKRQTAASEFHKHVRRGGVDTEIEDAVTWALVKGKCFVKLLWSDNGFEPYIVQPEMMGVLREDIDSLDRQEAFTHSSYYTPSRFAEIVKNHPDRDAIMAKAKRTAVMQAGGDTPESTNKLKQVILGGINPYQQAGSGRNPTRGVVDWLGGPSADISPEVMASLIRLDELWVWDDERDDYTTIQIVGSNIILAGENTHRNLFADMYDPANKEKNLKSSDSNPLSGKQPFNEICPNRLNGYFWGRSEICNVALLQMAINARVDGINNLLRRQEDPPTFFSGGGPPTQNAFNKIKKPGGYLVEQNPNAKVTSLAPNIPDGLWISLHEYEAMFDQMAGFTPTMQGRGEAGVRAAGHSVTLTRNASPRFKDRALLVERQVEAIGGLGLDMCKAKIPEPMIAWVMPNDANLEATIPLDNELEEPPVRTMKPIQFTFHDLDDRNRVVVDSHSSSPAFAGEARALLFDLFKIGAIDPETVVEHTHPPGQDAIIDDIKQAKVERAEFVAAHPEAIDYEMKKKKRK